MLVSGLVRFHFGSFVFGILVHLAVVIVTSSWYVKHEFISFRILFRRIPSLSFLRYGIRSFV